MKFDLSKLVVLKDLTVRGIYGLLNECLSVSLLFIALLFRSGRKIWDTWKLTSELLASGLNVQPVKTWPRCFCSLCHVCVVLCHLLWSGHITALSSPHLALQSSLITSRSSQSHHLSQSLPSHSHTTLRFISVRTTIILHVLKLGANYLSVSSLALSVFL